MTDCGRQPFTAFEVRRGSARSPLAHVAAVAVTFRRRSALVATPACTRRCIVRSVRVPSRLLRTRMSTRTAEKRLRYGEIANQIVWCGAGLALRPACTPSASVQAVCAMCRHFSPCYCVTIRGGVCADAAPGRGQPQERRARNWCAVCRVDGRSWRPPVSDVRAVRHGPHVCSGGARWRTCRSDLAWRVSTDRARAQALPQPRRLPCTSGF